MPKTFITLTIFLLNSNILFSQKDKQDKWDWGLKAGFNYGSIAAKDIYTGEELGFESTDVFVSIFTEFHFGTKISLQQEFGYSAIDDLLTWEFPLLTKYRFEDRFQIGLGPKFSYISNNHFGGQVLKTRWGMSIQGMLQYDICKHWLLETSYTYELNKKIDWPGLGFEDGKWRAFRLGIGYKF